MIFDSLWTNLQIESMDGSKKIKNDSIGVKNGKLSWIGKKNDLSKLKLKSSNKIVDGKNKLVTPGLIDCHTHLLFSGNRANEFEMRQKGATYEEISKKGGGIMSTVRATRNATEEELYKLGKHRLEQFLSEGVTTVEIKSGYGLDFESEIKLLKVATRLQKDLSIRIQRTFLGAHVCPQKSEYKSKDEYIDFLCNTLLPEVKKQKLADAVDGFCEKIAFNTAQIEKLFKKAKELGFPVKLHAEQLSNQNGVSIAAKFNAISVDHLEHISEDSIKKMKKSRTTAVLLPGAYYFLKEKQKPPVDLFRKHKVPIAIATDFNPGTSPINSLLTICNMAQVLFGLTTQESLRAVTKNAALALGKDKEIGTLEAGKNADFVIWDVESISEISYGINLNPKKTIVINGRVVYDTLGI